MGHQELLRQLHKRLLARASQKEASEVLGISESGISRKLQGEIPFTLPEFLTLSEHFGIDIHELADSAGFLSDEPLGWGILNVLSEEPPRDIAEISKRILSRLRDPIPDGGFEFEPTQRFFELERLQRIDKPKFQARVDALTQRFIDQNARRNKYYAMDIQGFAEVLDLNARRHLNDISKTGTFLCFALSLPIHWNSQLRLFLEEISSTLIHLSGHEQAEPYIRNTLSRAYTAGNDTLTARLLLLLATELYQQGHLQAAARTNEQILKLCNVDEALFLHRAAYNLALNLRVENQKRALQLINSIPIESIEHDPHFVFDLLWLGGSVRSSTGDPTGVTMMLTALKHQPHLQRPTSLLLLLEELTPLLPRSILLEEASAIAPFLENLRSPKVIVTARRFLESLKRQGPPYSLGLALKDLSSIRS